MSNREKDQADFDLEQFVDLFDTAMSSDNPAVQRALKNLLLIATMVNAEDSEAGMRQGPLRKVIEDQKNIIRRLQELENNGVLHKQYGPIAPSNPGFGPVPLGPYVGPPIQWPNTGNPPPNTIWCSATSAVSAHDQFSSESTSKYATLLDKLEIRS